VKRCPRCGYEFYVSSGKPTAKQRVEDCLLNSDKPLEPKEVSRLTRLDVRTVYRGLAKLLEEGKLKILWSKSGEVKYLVEF